MQQQPNWRFCQKCEAMFFDGFPDKGQCMAGGGHLAQGFNFNLPYDVAESASAQAAWCYCTKCHVMYYDGFADKGHCTAGGAHAADGFNFTLPHDVPENGNAQASWRFCANCKAMFYDGFAAKGICPAHVAPGPHGVVHLGHVASGFNFVLPYDTQSSGAVQVSLQGPVWMVELTHQQSESVEGSLGVIAGAIGGVSPGTGPGAPAVGFIAGAVAGAAGFIQLMDAIGGDQGVDVQGVLGVSGVIVTPRGSGLYQTLIAGTYAVGGVATLADILLKAGSQVPAMASTLGIGTAATVYAGVAAGNPLGWALVAALGGIVKLLEPAPDPNEHGGIHADRVPPAGDWEKFIMVQIPPGQQIALLAWQGLFSAQNGGGGDVYANRIKVGPWETWNLVNNHDDTVSFQTTDGHYLTATNGGGNGSFCKVDPTSIGSGERFSIENQPGGHIAIKTQKGTYLSVQPGK